MTGPGRLCENSPKSRKFLGMAWYRVLALHLRPATGMSPVGHALEERFGDVCRSELQRLKKKTSSLAPEHRAEVHALTLELTQRLALRLDAALTKTGGELDAFVIRLFAVPAPNVEDTQ
jgi:hypothetical protein